ncbi:hypothetical protein [Cohnella zeiphila]|uniref:Uncharacterized protein n=1 Tax=Cohnella zeiphila TaxID=2761120 RepID=A0A7X0SN39_9BACL|nr:hypothetical protein [Cohnella zeiphila]MBB6732919.1 hypothetical protein [Cohnella zeiphila]
MFEWFEKLVKDIVWKAIDDFLEALPGELEDKVFEFLSGLTAGETISASPLVKVLAVDGAAETVTLLVRGSLSFGGVTPFTRIEIVVSSARADIHADGSEPPIAIKRWNTVLGDLTVEKKKTYKGNLAFGYDDSGGGSWLGQGSLKLIPLSLGAGIYGGFSDRGVILGLDAEVPKGASIPLGPTGLALRGIGGDFAYNFIARLEKDGMPIPQPTAADYVKWARDKASVDRWQAGPIDQTSVGVGIRTIICTKADEGYAFEMNPVGFSFLLPGGTFIFGGKLTVLRIEGFGAEGYFVFDAASGSLALGVGVNVDMELFKGSGQLDLFFSFSDPAAWSLDLGTESKPVKLEVLQKVPVLHLLFSQKAEAYFRINHHRIAFGAALAIGGTFEIGDILKLVAKLAVSLNAYVGWDPVLVNAQIKVHGEVGIQVWKFEFVLTGDAEAEVFFPNPTLFKFEIKGKLNLPWPIPDVEFGKTFGDDVPTPPKLSSPLTAGTYVIDGAPTNQSTPVEAVHIISDMKWNLDADKPWPDLDLVVPFSRRVTDRTGKVDASQAVSPSVQGGYTVTDELLELELTDLTHNVPVADVRAVWADGPGGSTAQLHVLGLDPYSWITAQIDTSIVPFMAQERTVDTFFGYGPAQPLSGTQRFGEVDWTPMRDWDRLVTAFRPEIATRIAETSGFELRFTDRGGQSLRVSEVVLFLIMPAPKRSFVAMPLVTEDGVKAVYYDHGTVWGNLHLVSARFDFPASVDQFRLKLENERQRLNVYVVRYRTAAPAGTVGFSKKLLLPGRYRLHLHGVSSAAHPSGGAGSPLPPSKSVDWRYDKDFEIAYPETLRPYIFYSTFGDAALFARTQFPWSQWTADAWNPTLFGLGFPLYRRYKLAVRFLVPYVSGIFPSPQLKLRLTYEQGGERTETAVLGPTADGTSSLPPESANWIAARGGSVPPDEEIVMQAALPASGTAKLTILFEHPQNGEARLDEWSGCVSAFDDFRAHMAWGETSLSVYYDGAGRHVVPECPLPGGTVKLGKLDPIRHYGALSGIGSIVLDKKPLASKSAAEVSSALAEAARPADLQIRSDIGSIIHSIPDTIQWPVKPYPEELTVPPSDWRLPSELASQVGPLDGESALRFVRFAAASGARFGAGDVHLAGLNDTVTGTTVEAVVDGKQRPYALWLRTPEPIDWRRVGASLRIRHVEPDTGCPNGYAYRRELVPDVAVLPSFDGSSAWLVGSLGGIPMKLPRGEYTLTLTFDSRKAGLPPLYPDVAAGASPETASLRFVMPLGLKWPLPAGGITPVPIPIPIPIPIPVKPVPVPIPDPHPEWLRDAASYFAPAAGTSADSAGETPDASASEISSVDRPAFLELPLPGPFRRVANLISSLPKGE